MAKGGAEGDIIPSGAFGRGGHHRVAGFLWFCGCLGPAFARFAQARARRLSLNGSIRYGQKRAIVRIEGPEALVGAFEMACVIGPEVCFVDEWSWLTADTLMLDSESFSAFDDCLEF